MNKYCIYIKTKVKFLVVNNLVSFIEIKNLLSLNCQKLPQYIRTLFATLKKMYVITEYSLFVSLLYWGHTCLIAMDTNRTHRSVARCLARPSQQPMKGMVTCTMPGIVMSLVVPFRVTRCDVKESVVGRVFQRYSRGQDVKVLQLADVTAKVTIPYWLIIQGPVCSSGRQSSPGLLL